MDKQSYESLIESEIQSTIARLLAQGSGTINEVRLRSALDALAQRIASHTRSYELLGIRSSDDLALEWNVSKRRVQAHIQSLHERFGVGRKFGRDWFLSAEEAERHRPRPYNRSQ